MNDFEKRIKTGKEALDVGLNVILRLPRWKMIVIRWLWPDILTFIKALFEYCMNANEEIIADCTKEMGVDWGIKPKTGE